MAVWRKDSWRNDSPERRASDYPVVSALEASMTPCFIDRTLAPVFQGDASVADPDTHSKCYCRLQLVGAHPPEGGLSIRAIIGIVVGVIAAITAVVVLLLFRSLQITRAR